MIHGLEVGTGKADVLLEEAVQLPRRLDLAGQKQEESQHCRGHH